MGGGGQSGGAGTYFDTPDAAMQSAYNQYPSQFDWGMAAKGFQQAGSAIAGGGQTPNFMTAAHQPAAMQSEAPFNVGDQGMVIGTDRRLAEYEQMQALQDALRRIEATQKKSKVIEPETGAAQYWYVDPRASTGMPTAEDLYRYPEGTPPSF